MAAFGVFAVVVALTVQIVLCVRTTVVDFYALPGKQLSSNFDGSLSLHCEVPGNVITTTAKDLSLTVYKESATGVREIIASVSPSESVNHVGDNPMLMSVHIANQGSMEGQSFLNITWIKFTKDLIGQYFCEAKVQGENVSASSFENSLIVSFLQTTTSTTTTTTTPTTNTTTTPTTTTTTSTTTTTTTPTTTTTTTTKPTTTTTTTTTTTKPPKPSGGGGNDGCFPPLSIVLLETGERKYMKDLKIGDKTLSLTRNGDLVFSEVFMFLHKSNTSYAKYFVVKTNNGKGITASPEHLLYVLSKPFNSSVPGFTDVKFTEDIEIGDFVSTLTNNTDSRMELSAHRVVAKESVFLQGMYAPVTTDGTIVVDDVIASCYANTSNVGTSHVLFAPIRILHAFGKLLPGWLMNSDGPMDGVHWYVDLLLYLAPAIRYARNQWRFFQITVAEMYINILPH